MDESCGKVSAERPGRVGNLAPGRAIVERPERARKRRYSAKDAGRIICYAVGAGASPREIKEAAGCCLPEDDCEKVKQLVRQFLPLLAILLSIVPVITGAVAVLRRIRRVPVVGTLLGRSLPLLALETTLEVIDLAVSEYTVIAVELTALVSKD